MVKQAKVVDIDEGRARALTIEEAAKQLCRRCGAAIDRRRVAADSSICEGCIQAEKFLRSNISRKPLPGQQRLF